MFYITIAHHNNSHCILLDANSFDEMIENVKQYCGKDAKPLIGDKDNCIIYGNGHTAFIKTKFKK